MPAHALCLKDRRQPLRFLTEHSVDRVRDSHDLCGDVFRRQDEVDAAACIRIAGPPLLGATRRSSGHASGLAGVYFLSAPFFSAGALDVDFGIDVVGTMMWAYGVPFHITHGPPLVQSVG